MITNYSKYHVEVEQVPVEYGSGLASTIGTGQAIYCNDQMQFPLFDTEDDTNFMYSGAGYTIPSVHIKANEDSDDVNAGVWSLPLKQKKD